VIGGIDVYGADSLQMVMDHLVSDRRMTTTSINIEEKISETPPGSCPDFSEIRGQYLARRAAEIAAAGMHNLLLSGPPGAGKTMIASRIAGILPPMDAEEALEVSQIHSVAGVLPEDGILTTRPFRMPHHTISAAAMAGGGAAPRPGEISLAHRGVLYLDELPEFQQDTLEILRQPLEEGQVRIARSSGSCTFPADFMLVASRNPCRCGYYPDRRICKCSEREVARYLHRISRPLLDRIDLHVAVEPMRYEDLESDACEETTAQIRARVLLAHERQRARYRETDCRFNADLTAAQMKRYCPLTDEASALLQKVYQQKNLTARTYHRLIRVARTIADLEGQDQITYRHISEAVLYRPDPQLM
jgi:magnesium chelatase family protein